MTKRFEIGVEIYQKPSGRFEVHLIKQHGKFDDDKRVATLIENDDDEGYNDYEFYANALCIGIRELLNG